MEQSNIKVIVPQNCGNSPKINFIKELNISMAKRNLQFLYDHITDDIKWSILGVQKLIGKNKVIKLMEELRDLSILELNLQTIITHGTAGAVNGVVILRDSSRIEYCSIYTFTSNSKNIKIKEMTTYFHTEK